MEKSAGMFILALVLTLGAVLADETSPSPLFERPGHYSFAYSARADCGFAVPTGARSRLALAGALHVTVPTRGMPMRVQLKDLKHAVDPPEHTTEDFDDGAGLSYGRLPSETSPLSKPFLVQLHSETGMALTIRLPRQEPLWVVNMKRAIAVALQFQRKELPGAFKVNEPCLHGSCVTEYSSSDGVLVRKSSNVPTLIPTPSHRLWISIMPNVCTKDTKNPLIGNSEKWYTLDERGMVKLESYGSIEIHYHKHILKSSVNITLERQEITESAPSIIQKEFPVEKNLAFEPPPHNELTGGRAPLPTEGRLELLYNFLAKAAEGLEQHGPRDTLLRDKLPMEIHRIMSTLSYENLKSVYNELDVGTSYKRETMQNIFLEALPQCWSPASILLARDIVQEGKAGDVISLILRKLPFSVQELSPKLLSDMEPLLKLGQEHPAAVRHSAILAFSTLVFRTFITGQCTEDTFEDYTQIYFSRFTESPDYADRLAWLMGLSNLQLQQVHTYLAPIIAGGLGHSQHERFLAVWATMGLAHLFPQEVHDLYWPILQNPTEPLEMRVAAVTMLILAEPSSHRLLSLHWYVQAQHSGHLKHFFYTTIKSLQHTTFDCYKHISKMASYLSKLSKSPGPRFWATGNYLVDASDQKRDMSMMAQTFMVADPNTGLPNVFYFTLIINNAGLVVNDFAIYLKIHGVAGSFLSKLRQINGESVRLERLVEALKEAEVTIRIPALVHVEFLIKYQGKTIMATHINQTSFDKWTDGDMMKTIDNFLQAESHVNQQILLYPTLLVSILPSDLGMPVQTDTMLASLTSIRGNLTHQMRTDVFARNNDVHFRTSTLALLSLNVYNPVADSRHTAEVAQVMDVYLPANFTIGMVIPTKTFKSTWLQPHGVLGPGMTAYSGAKVIMRQGNAESQILSLKTPGQPTKANAGGISLTCEGPTKPTQLVWQIINSHNSNAATAPWAKPLLVLLHAMTLAAVPAEGTCSLSLMPPEGKEGTTRTSAELQVLQILPTKMLFRAGIVKRKEDDDTIVSRINSTSQVELSEKGFKFATKFNGITERDAPEWKSCLEANSNQGGDGMIVREIDVSLAYGAGSSGKVCPTETEMKLQLRSMAYLDHTDYNAVLSAKNISDSLVKVAKHASSILTPLESLAGLEDSPMLSLAVLATDVAIDASDGRTARKEGTAKGPGAPGIPTVTDLLTGGAWLLGPKRELKLLSNLGVMRECAITRDTVVTLREEEHKLQPFNCSLLLLGDCTRTPHFALFLLPSAAGLSIRLYTGGNYADITAMHKDFTVSVNDEPISYKPVYAFPQGETFYDFEITEGEQAGKILVDSKLGALKLEMTREKVVVQLPATQMDRGCGRCMDHTQLYTLC